MNEEYKRTILCSAFPGTGKSFYYQHQIGHTVLDADSSTFDKTKFPQNYIDHIKENIGKVDIILISSHKEVREALEENEMNFYLIYPDIALKEEYIERYKKRGDKKAFVKLLKENWENWIKEIEESTYPLKIRLQSGQYIKDVLG